MSPAIKVNFDGAVFRGSDEAGIGVVARDSQGLVLAPMSKKSYYLNLLLMLKLKAIVRAVQFAQEL